MNTQSIKHNIEIIANVGVLLGIILLQACASTSPDVNHEVRINENTFELYQKGAYGKAETWAESAKEQWHIYAKQMCLDGNYKVEKYDIEGLPSYGVPTVTPYVTGIVMCEEGVNDEKYPEPWVSPELAGGEPCPDISGTYEQIADEATTDHLNVWLDAPVQCPIPRVDESISPPKTPSDYPLAAEVHSGCSLLFMLSDFRYQGCGTRFLQHPGVDTIVITQPSKNLIHVKYGTGKDCLQTVGGSPEFTLRADQGHFSCSGGRITMSPEYMVGGAAFPVLSDTRTIYKGSNGELIINRHTTEHEVLRYDFDVTFMFNEITSAPEQSQK